VVSSDHPLIGHCHVSTSLGMKLVRTTQCSSVLQTNGKPACVEESRAKNTFKSRKNSDDESTKSVEVWSDCAAYARAGRTAGVADVISKVRGRRRYVDVKVGNLYVVSTGYE